MSLEAFEHTSVGFRRAKRWLKTNQFTDLLQQYGSDASALVNLANELRSKNDPAHIEPEYRE